MRIGVYTYGLERIKCLEPILIVLLQQETHQYEQGTEFSKPIQEQHNETYSGIHVIIVGSRCLLSLSTGSSSSSHLQQQKAFTSIKSFGTDIVKIETSTAALQSSLQLTEQKKKGMTITN